MAAALATLPHDRTPAKRKWERLSGSWGDRLDAQIAGPQALRDELSDCIGCDCLSRRSCAIFNPSRRAAEKGSAPRYLVGDERLAIE